MHQIWTEALLSLLQSYRCSGTTHKSSECYFRNETCWKCGKVGHIQRVSRSGKSQNCTRRRKEEKPNLYAFKVDDERDDDTCSLVALLEANNFNHVAAGDVIWWHQKNGNWHIDRGSAILTTEVSGDIPKHTTSGPNFYFENLLRRDYQTGRKTTCSRGTQQSG